MKTFTRDLYGYEEKVDTARAVLIGMCANSDLEHHAPRALAARAITLAEAFFDELDAREQAAEAREAETEPPPSPLLDSDVAEDEIDEDPPAVEDEKETAFQRGLELGRAEPPRQPNQIARVWTDLDRAPQS